MKKKQFMACFLGAALTLSMLAGCSTSAVKDTGSAEKAVDTAAVQVEDTAPKNNGKKTVYILATGGTIAGSGDSGKTQNYKAGELDVQSLIDGVPGIEDLANLEGIQICNIGSDDITAQHWLKITNTINELAKKEDVAGFVITHGTDTLDETAYFMNLTVKTDKPVVLVGAMRPSTATSADGPMNLYQAVALAASEEAVGRGSMVVFSDGIYGGRDVQKTNTFKTDAFDSRDLGCLGYMHDEVPYFFNDTTKLHTTETEFDVSGLEELPKVGIAYFNIDADPSILSYMAETCDGIIIAGAGSGCYSESWNEEIAKLADKKTIIVRSSRISNGLISEDDYFNVSPYVMDSGNLAPQKARILLQLALTKTSDINEIKAIFEKY